MSTRATQNKLHAMYGPIVPFMRELLVSGKVPEEIGEVVFSCAALYADLLVDHLAKSGRGRTTASEVNEFLRDVLDFDYDEEEYSISYSLRETRQRWNQICEPVKWATDTRVWKNENGKIYVVPPSRDSSTA